MGRLPSGAPHTTSLTDPRQLSALALITEALTKRAQRQIGESKPPPLVSSFSHQSPTSDIPCYAVLCCAVSRWKIQGVLRGHSGDVLDLCWSPDASSLVTGESRKQTSIKPRTISLPTYSYATYH